MPLCVSQRDVTSDPEAVRQVAMATNNLLDSLGSLAVEVRNTPVHPTPLGCHLYSVRRVVQRTDASVFSPTSAAGRGHWVYLAARRVSGSLCVQIKAVFLQQRQMSSQLNKESNVSAGFHFTVLSGGENTSLNKQQTLSVLLRPAPGPAETLRLQLAAWSLQRPCWRSQQQRRLC